MRMIQTEFNQGSNLLKNSIMKLSCSILCLVNLVTLNSYGQTFNTTIHGKLDQMKDGTTIAYTFMDKARLSTDFNTVTSKGNEFVIKLNLAAGEGGELLLVIGKGLRDAKSNTFIYVDKGTINLNSIDSLFTDLSYSGSTFATELNNYHQLMRSTPKLAKYETIRQSMFKAQRDKDVVTARQRAEELKPLDSIRKILALEWVARHPASPISVFVIHNGYEPLANKLNNKQQLDALRKLSPEAKANQMASEMLYKFESENVVAIGKPAPEFTQNDTLGRPVSLKDFRGKYVLIDFWASWCVPCRAENPHVVAAFQKYKNKGFTVLGVSLDQPGKKADWLKAIQVDRLTWTHVSDLKFWGNAVALLYNINAVPANFLIGPDGVILAKNLKGDDLDQALAKYLNN